MRIFKKNPAGYRLRDSFLIVITGCPKKENLPKEIGRALIKNH